MQKFIARYCQRDERPIQYLIIHDDGRQSWTAEPEDATRFDPDKAVEINRSLNREDDYLPYAQWDLNDEQEAEKILAAAGYQVRGKHATAFRQLVEIVADDLSDWEEIEEEAGRDGLDAWDYVEGAVSYAFQEDLYHQPLIQVRRTIRVTCPPEDVVTTGTAAEIGFSWSTASSIEDPTFLDQYGKQGGRDVAFVAEIKHDDINWPVTIARRMDPRVRDYEEIVLKADARPNVLSVSDPAAQPVMKPN